LGPHPKPEAGELLQIILRVPPVCGCPLAGGGGAVVVAGGGGAAVVFGGAGAVVAAGGGGAALVWAGAGGAVVVAEEHATIETSTTTNRKQASRVNLDFFIYSSLFIMCRSGETVTLFFVDRKTTTFVFAFKNPRYGQRLFFTKRTNTNKAREVFSSHRVPL